jgi:DNA repair exonuclease SbcCD nuclease subunit
MYFIHTADWQIGMRAVHAGSAAQEVRTARLSAAERVCSVASQEGVDFLLLAGDTFEDNSVDRQLIIQVAGILGSITIPVFVLPGNHDPLLPGSVWEHPVWKTCSNVTVLRERTPFKVPGGTLLPCPIFSRRSPEDPTSWIANDSADGICVVVAHGNAGELMAEDGGFPIAVDTPARTNADYVALGHWHSTVLFSDGSATRMAYSGTPEATRFGEADSGNILLVRIPVHGAPPQIETRKIGELRWERIGTGETITTPGKLEDIARKLAQMPDQEKTLLDVVLSGLLFERDRDELPRIESACSRFLSARLDKSALRPAPNDDDWVRHLPAGAVRTTAAKLQQMASRPGETAEIATQALLELYTFAHEVQL